MTDVVIHAEIVRAQQQLAQLQADIAAARQAIADVQQVAAGSVIKSVQRGVIALPNASLAAVSVRVSQVDVSKSVLSFMGAYGGSLSDMSGIAGQFAMVRLVDSTTVTAQRKGVGNGDYLMVGFELTEYK